MSFAIMPKNDLRNITWVQVPNKKLKATLYDDDYSYTEGHTYELL